MSPSPILIRGPEQHEAVSTGSGLEFVTPFVSLFGSFSPTHFSPVAGGGKENYFVP